MAFLFYLDHMNHVCVNGKIMAADEAAIQVSNRGYRYGDGLFETMKRRQNQILLGALHFERLFYGMALLKFNVPEYFNPDRISREITELCRKNECNKLARVRLSVSRGNGGLYDDTRDFCYSIECWPLKDSINDSLGEGMLIDIYPDARKSCDLFSNLKSANFLPYAMAAIHAQEIGLDDCLLLNINDRIADSTTANIFLVKGDKIVTPPLTEGCVSGVMRKFLLKNFNNRGYQFLEEKIEVDDLLKADEIFLTNAIHGLRWVKQFREKTYTNSLAAEILDQLGEIW